MQHRDGRFNGAEGHSIYFQCWMPDTQARAVILLVHGAGEHSSRYQFLAQCCCARGFAVAALDHIGHGRSDGDRGHVDRFRHYLQTLQLFLHEVQATMPGIPVLLLGHSMGGLMAAAWLLENPGEITACALSGPAIATELEPGPVQIALIRLLSLLLPKLGVMQLDAAGVSRDKAVVETYTADPLVHHGKFSARFVCELFATMQEVQARAGSIHLPLLILHGEADVMTDPVGSRLLYDRAASEDKSLKIYPGLFHEIFNEPEKEQVIGDLLDWFEAHLPAG